jgi:hypothetical protein
MGRLISFFPFSNRFFNNSIPTADVRFVREQIHPDSRPSNSDIDSHYRVNIGCKRLLSPIQCQKTHQKELVSDPKEQLKFLLLIFCPPIREFVADLCEDPVLWKAVFTPSDEILLCYCYLSISIATQHVDQWKYENRVASFESADCPWPLGNQLSAGKMAEFGFFRREPYAKQQTTCFVCGCVLSEWVATDTVVDGHSQFRPQCPFMWIMIFLKKTLLTSFKGRYRDVEEDPREYASLGNHSRLLTNQVPQRLQKLSAWYETLDISFEQLTQKEMESIIIVRDIFCMNKMDILFTLCKKVFRYWNTLKSMVTQRDILIDVKHLYPTGVVLMKDILQNRRNASNLPYIAGGMPTHSQFVEPPWDGALSLISQYKEILNSETSSNSSPIFESRFTSVYPAYPSHNVGVNSVGPTIESSLRRTVGPTSQISIPSSTSQSSAGLEFVSDSVASMKKLPQSVEKALSNRLCVKCMRRSSVYLILPCRHLSVCSVCASDPKSVEHCPACNSQVTDVIRVYTT